MLIAVWCKVDSRLFIELVLRCETELVLFFEFKYSRSHVLGLTVFAFTHCV